MEALAIRADMPERQSKECFFEMLQARFCSVVESLGYPNPESILKFEVTGSFVDGFGAANSDVDIHITLCMNNDLSHDQIRELETILPRALEKNLLDAGIGSRFVGRARAPNLMVYSNPSPELLALLRSWREKWEKDTGKDKILPARSGTNQAMASRVKSSKQDLQSITTRNGWRRDGTRSPLYSPESSVHIQADIIFSYPPALWISHLLCCYSLCDPRVKEMVVFVKTWAKQRKIKSSPNGTLHSYGYVLMVIHFLTNVSAPPVLPNLHTIQQSQFIPSELDGDDIYSRTYREGIGAQDCNAKFWGDKRAIQEAAQRGKLTQNQDSLGVLLRNFFRYYANADTGRGFQWTKEVISIRTPGGLLDKEAKGWTSPTVTVIQNVRVRHHFLLAIEDPFRLDYNLGDQVSSEGLAAIQDEFRRAWHILTDIGHGVQPEEYIFDVFVEPEDEILPIQNHNNSKSVPSDNTVWLHRLATISILVIILSVIHKNRL